MNTQINETLLSKIKINVLYNRGNMSLNQKLSLKFSVTDLIKIDYEFIQNKKASLGMLN